MSDLDQENTLTKIKNFASEKASSITTYLAEKKLQKTVPQATSHYFQVFKAKFIHLFTEHPTSKNMTYWQHMYGSLAYFILAFGATLSFLLHGIFPFLFETRGSQLAALLFKKLMDDGVMTSSDFLADCISPEGDVPPKQVSETPEQQCGSIVDSGSIRPIAENVESKKPSVDSYVVEPETKINDTKINDTKINETEGEFNIDL